MGNRIQADAEVLATTIKALESLKLPEFIMHVNHIAIAKALIKQAGVPDANAQAVLMLIDKLDKKSEFEVA